MNTPRVPGRPGLSRGAPSPTPGRPGTPRPPGYRPPPPAASAGKMPLMLGLGGGVLAILLVVVVMSGGEKKPAAKPEAAPPPPPAAAAPKKPVDVSGLENDGHKSCEEGLAIIQALEPKIAADTAGLSDAEQAKLKTELKKGMDLIKKGMELLGEANEKSGRTYDLNRYIQAKKLAANKWQGLKGE